MLNCLCNERYVETYLNERLSDKEKIFISFLLAYFIVRGKKWREFGEKSFKKMEELIREAGKTYKVDNIEKNTKNEIYIYILLKT